MSDTVMLVRCAAVERLSAFFATEVMMVVISSTVHRGLGHGLGQALDAPGHLVDGDRHLLDGGGGLGHVGGEGPAASWATCSIEAPISVIEDDVSST